MNGDAAKVQLKAHEQASSKRRSLLRR